MITRRQALLSGIVLATPGGGLAQAPLDPVKAVMEQGLYLPELARLREAARSSSGQGQVLAQYLATLGDEAGALRQWMSLRPSTALVPPPDMTDYSLHRAEPALDAIVSAARGRRLVILNEAHHGSRCRSFAAKVIDRLRAEGFNLLAAEDFSNEPETRFAERMASGQPVTTDLVYYGRDPVYAGLIRQARAAGYRLPPYEMTEAQRPSEDADGPTRIATREAAEAANLAALLKDDSEARMIVYCGHGHVAEQPMGGNTLMAARLKAATGIDPLTIEQALCLPSPPGVFESPTITAVLAHFKPTEPIIVRDPEGAPLVMASYRGVVDLAVFHPRLPDDADGRPGWLARDPDLCRASARFVEAVPKGALVQAVLHDEAKAPNVVPSDQYLISAETRDAVFYLRRGIYQIRVETDGGRRITSMMNVTRA